MHIHETIRGEVAIVTLKGDLMDDSDILEIQQKVRSLIIDGIHKVIFDLGSIRHINSKGLDTLRVMQHSMRELGGDIRFAQIDHELDNVFVQERLVRNFVTFETVGRALASFLL